MYAYRKLTPEERRKLIEERKSRGLPPHSPPHPRQDAEYYLLTATCYEHGAHMEDTARRQPLLDLLFEHSMVRGVELRAWVVLPNYYHLQAYVPGFEVLSEMFRRVHGLTARYENPEEGAPGRKVWYRFADRAMRSQRHYYTTLNYIYCNPVKVTAQALAGSSDLAG